MSEPDPTGYGESPDTADANLVDGTPDNDPADVGEQDTTLTTDDDAQRDDLPTRPGNTAS